MKHITLPIEDLTLDRLLAGANRKKAVFLTKNGRVRFVLMPADDGDQEVCALENNHEFLLYLREAEERARTGKRFSLEEVRARTERQNGKVQPKTARRAVRSFKL